MSMPNFFKRVMIFVSFSCVLIMSNPSIVAADLFTGGDSGVNCSAGSSTSQSAVCGEHDTTDNPLTGCPSNCGSGELDHVTDIIAYIAGGAAVIVMIIGAIRFVTSGSDVSVGSRIDDDVLNAKRSITGALIGLAIIVLAKTLIVYVLSKINP
jgi:hypothetical protein